MAGKGSGSTSGKPPGGTGPGGEERQTPRSSFTGVPAGGPCPARRADGDRPTHIEECLTRPRATRRPAHTAEDAFSTGLVRPSSRSVRRSTIESAISPLRTAMFDNREEDRPWVCSVPPWR